MKVDKFGICEWVLPTYGPFALQLASEIGYEGIQLGDLGGAGMGFPLNHPRIQQGYMDASKEFNIQIHSIHLHTLVRDGTMLFPMNTCKGKEGLLSIDKGIEACAKMNVPILMLSSFFASLVRNEYEFNNFATMLQYACKKGSENNVKIVYECILPIDRILKMLDVVGDNLEICYDTLNPIRNGTGNPQDEIKKLGKAINHIHVKDAPHDYIGCCLLGEGIGELKQTSETLDKIGYSGWYVTENYYCQPPMDGDPLALAKKDLENMRCLFTGK